MLVALRHATIYHRFITFTNVFHKLRRGLHGMNQMSLTTNVQKHELHIIFDRIYKEPYIAKSSHREMLNIN